MSYILFKKQLEYYFFLFNKDMNITYKFMMWKIKVQKYTNILNNYEIKV